MKDFKKGMLLDIEALGKELNEIDGYYLDNASVFTINRIAERQVMLSQRNHLDIFLKKVIESSKDHSLTAFALYWVKVYNRTTVYLADDWSKSTEQRFENAVNRNIAKGLIKICFRYLGQTEREEIEKEMWMDTTFF